MTGPCLVSTFLTSHAENNVELTMLVPLMKATFMPRMTCHPAAMTTRKRAIAAPRRLLAAALVGVALGGAGCATQGPLHVYTLTAEAERPITDTGNGRTAEAPSFLEPEDRISGFAYDPFTDHFFLRLEPGPRIRVVDRPARAIKRELDIAGAPRGGGDLAVRPKDGHLFLLGPEPGQILEVTRFGKLLGEFVLADTRGHVIGLALDTIADRLLALGADGRRVTVHDLRGKFVRELRLDRPAGPALAYDSDQREFYAPLRDRPEEIAVFSEAGRFVRTHPAPAAGLVDLGQRSLIRVF